MEKHPNTADFTRRLDAVLRTFAKIPTQIATIAVNFSKERFQEQAWLDSTKKKWLPLRYRRGSKSSRRSQTPLVKTGRLKRSIRKIEATSRRIIIGTDLPYAKLHNDGGAINNTVTVKSYQVSQHKRKRHTRTRAGRVEKVKAHTVKSHTVSSHRRKLNIRVPSRKFIGESYTLTRRIELFVTSQINKALKK